MEIILLFRLHKALAYSSFVFHSHSPCSLGLQFRTVFIVFISRYSLCTDLFSYEFLTYFVLSVIALIRKAPYSSTCFSHPLCRPVFIFRSCVLTNFSTKLSCFNLNAYSIILFLENFKGVVSVPIIHCLSLSAICPVSQLQLFQILHCTFFFCSTSCPHSAVPLAVSFPSVRPSWLLLTRKPSLVFDDWLTVLHRSITLVDLQLDAQNSYLFIYI
jgi:hypothetical protein